MCTNCVERYEEHMTYSYEGPLDPRCEICEKPADSMPYIFGALNDKGELYEVRRYFCGAEHAYQASLN